MKKVLAFILAIALLAVPAFADVLNIDLENATDEELAAALTAIQTEQKARLKTHIVLNTNEVTLGMWGSSQLTASAADLADGVTAGQFTWTSSNTAVVSVSGGWLSAVGQGTAVVTCTTVLSDGTEISADCSVTVLVAVTGVSSQNWSMEVGVGKTVQAAFTVQPTNATNQELAYESSDTSVAVIDGQGVITGVSIGQCTITASSIDGSNKTASFQLNVVNKGDLGTTQTTKDGIAVTLLSFRTGNGSYYLSPSTGNTFVYPKFEISNGSSDTLSVSSVLCFDAECDSYSVNYSFTAACGAQGDTLDATVYPGKKLQGEYGIEVPADWKEITVYVRFGLLSSPLSFTFYNNK